MSAVSDQPRLKFHHLPAVAVGNALEFYDFITYAFFAVHIGHAFFPSSTPGIGLLKSLATFGVGFLTRPLGGFVIGRLGDRLGRKPAMMISFGLMGVSIVGLAFTPPVSRIGLAAPILAVSFRLLQGFALGGEVGPATAFLVEAAPLKWQGFVVSLQSATQNLAILVASGVGLGLTWVLGATDLDLYGWRIAFLVGALVVPLGLWIRSGLPETLHTPEKPTRGAPPVRLLIALGSVLLLSATVQTYVQTYMTTYAITSLHLEERLAFIGQVVGGICGLLVGPAAAALSDRWHRRRPLLVYPAIARVLTTLPIFWLMVHYHNAVALLGGVAVLNILSAASPVAVVVVEALPQHIRARAFGLTYALVISGFGGTTQFVVQALINGTHNPLAPAWYMSVCVAVALLAMFALPETAPGRAKAATAAV